MPNAIAFLEGRFVKTEAISHGSRKRLLVDGVSKCSGILALNMRYLTSQD